MKFNAIAVASLATGVLADIGTITSAVNAVGKGIESLDSSLKSFSGNPQPIQDAADKLVSTLKDSKSKVEGSDKLTLADALGLQEPVKGLQSKSEQLVQDLKTGKPQIEKGGYCSLVRSKLSAVSQGSNDLIKAVVGKVPEEAQTVAAGLAAPLKKALAEADSEFSEQNCKGGKGGSSSAPASSAPASSAPASSAPASSAPTSSEEEETSAPATSAPAATSGYPVPSGSASTPYQPTGTGVPTGSQTAQPPMVTAGAAIVAPAGVLAMAAAALML